MFCSALSRARVVAASSRDRQAAIANETDQATFLRAVYGSEVSSMCEEQCRFLDLVFKLAKCFGAFAAANVHFPAGDARLRC